MTALICRVCLDLNVNWTLLCVNVNDLPKAHFAISARRDRWRHSQKTSTLWWPLSFIVPSQALLFGNDPTTVDIQVCFLLVFIIYSQSPNDRLWLLVHVVRRSEIFASIALYRTCYSNRFTYPNTFNANTWYNCKVVVWLPLPYHYNALLTAHVSRAWLLIQSKKRFTLNVSNKHTNIEYIVFHPNEFANINVFNRKS